MEVRFDDLCASAVGPEGAADGLFTVGVDLQVKAMARSLSRSPMVHKAPPHGVDIDDLAATPAVHGSAGSGRASCVRESAFERFYVPL